MQSKIESIKNLNLHKAIIDNNLIKIPPVNLKNINEVEYLLSSFTFLINSSNKPRSYDS